MSGPCICGDTECPSCGTAQGTYEPPELTVMCSWEDCDQEAIYCAGHARELIAPQLDELASALRLAMATIERLADTEPRRNSVQGTIGVALRALNYAGKPI